MSTIAQARLAACRLWPCGAHAILSLTPVESPGLGTLSVDCHGRLYYDPQALAGWSDGEAAGVILHEVCHLLFKHHARAASVVGEPSDASWNRWNVAADYAVNDLLAGEGVKLPAGVLYPSDHGFPSGLSAERYYRLLDREEEQASAQQPAEGVPAQPQGPPTNDDTTQPPSGEPNDEPPAASPGHAEADGAVDGGDQPAAQGAGGADPAPDQTGESGGGADDPAPAQQGESGGASDRPGDARRGGGSCADGQARSWELPPPDAAGDAPPGLKPHELDILARQTAERILEKGRGKGAGGGRQWAERILCPRLDPRRALLVHVHAAVEQASGVGDYSYRRPSRRSPSPDTPLPAHISPVVRITVIVDTSGSMDQHDLGLALGLVGSVLKHLPQPDGLRVVCGDDERQAAARVFDPNRIVLAGGGGTDMSRLIVEAAKERPRPNLIVVVTDGETPWPQSSVGLPVVVCVTRAESRYSPVPAWMRKVVLNE